MINPTEFINEIEILKKTLSLTYMESIVYWCEARGLDVETVASIVKKNRTIKSKLKAEAEDLNFIKKKRGSVLPL